MFFKLFSRLLLFFTCFLNICLVQAETYLFSHGFTDNHKQAYSYVKEYKKWGRIFKNNYYVIDGDLETFNYPDALIKPLVRLNKTSLGQDNEIKTLKNACDKIDDDVVLVGVSRGAATAINFVALHDPKNVKALVLEAPFDHVDRVFDHAWYTRLMSKILYSGTNRRLQNLFAKISHYDLDGQQPINLVDKIRKDLPIIFICSESDNVIKYEASENLYKKLRSLGHKHVYLLKFKPGRHARLLWSKNGEIYQNVVHAFYKKYGLLHNDLFARRGEPYFKKCQPEIDDLKTYFIGWDR